MKKAIPNPGDEVINLLTQERFTLVSRKGGEVVLESEGQKSRVDEIDFREYFLVSK